MKPLRGSDSDNDCGYNSEDIVVPKGFCAICGKPSTCRCRCGDFYCSGACLNLDWPSHRYICTPMPSLVYSKEMCDTYDTAHMPMDENNFKDKEENNYQKNDDAPIYSDGTLVLCCVKNNIHYYRRRSFRGCTH